MGLCSSKVVECDKQEKVNCTICATCGIRPTFPMEMPEINKTYCGVICWEIWYKNI